MIHILYADDWLYAKGHVDKAEFAREVEHQYGTGPLPHDAVEHCYLRCVPAPPGSDYDIILLRQGEPQRGAFAATLYQP